MSPDPGPFRSAAALKDDILAGRTSVRAVVDETLRRIDLLEAAVDAFLYVDREGALARAKELDGEIQSGRRDGRLLGVPVAVKDNICVRGLPTTCGSRILEGYVPPYDAHVIGRLRAEGAVLIGKTNCDEFAMGSSTENSAFKATRNPHDLARVPGGSSGGSAAAVAAGMVPLALGSDTGGSIRQPGALCGVVGFKPTYGTVSRRGLVAFASSLDQVGPLAGSVRDAAVLASAISGGDAGDSTCIDGPARDYAAALRPNLEGVRIGLHRDHLEEIADTEVRGAVARAVTLLREAGARLVRVDDVDLLSRHAVPTYYLLAMAEASANLARYDGMRFGPREAAADLRDCYAATRGARFGAEVKRRILLGTFTLSAGYADAFYKKALLVRRRFQQAFAHVFERVDLLAGATSPLPAFPLGERVADPLAMYQCDVLTVPASLAGLPAVTVPCGQTAAALPVGLQLIGPPLADAAVLSAAFAFEQKSGFKGRLAPLAERVR